MLSTIVLALKKIIVTIMVILHTSIPVTLYAPATITVMNEDCKATMAVISDIHLTDSASRQAILELGLLDMAGAEDKLDAVVFTGDITDHGYIPMWERFADAVGKYDIAQQTIIVEGNHDTWGPDRDNLDTVKQTFIDYNKKISNRDVDNMYYTTDVNGYPVIVIGSEADNTDCYLSQTQLDWFKAQMDKASATGLPIFVFSHYPINCTHGLPFTWELDREDGPLKGGLGEQSDAFYSIISQYKNVFYVTGHIHSGFANEGSVAAQYVSVEQHDGLTLVNLPSYMYPDVQRGGWAENGCGYVFEVYDDEVLIRARNFITEKWIEKYDVTIEITK